MNYKEITADEYEKLLKNKNDIFNKTFKNTDKLVEDKKQILETDPDAIIKKQQKDEYIEKLSDIISEKINVGKDMINIKKIVHKTKPHFKNDYIHYIKNPNILADMIVEIYNNNPNANVYMPKKRTKVKLQYVVNKIDKDENIDDQYKDFVRAFRNIPGNTYIEYTYQTYKDLVLDRINEPSIDDSLIKKIGKKFVENLEGRGINDYNTIKIDKDALKKNILKIRYNNGRKVNNKYLHDDMLISNKMKNAILKNTNVNKLSKDEYHVYILLNKYRNDDTNLLISSYLAGNTSADLYNTINKNLYNKLKNNEITKTKYNNILKKINNINI